MIKHIINWGLFSETKLMGLIFQIWLTQLPLGGFLTCPQLPLGVWPARRGILEEGVWKGISCWHKLHTRMAPGTESACPHPPGSAELQLQPCSKPGALAGPPGTQDSALPPGWTWGRVRVPQPRAEKCRAQGCPRLDFYCWNPPMASA